MSLRAKVLGVVVLAAIAGGAIFALSNGVTAKENPADGNTVAAIVNGESILKKDVLATLESIPQGQGMDAEKIYPMLLDNAINEKLIDTATVTAKVATDPEFQKRLEAVKTQLTRQLYLENLIKQKVTDEALKGEYEKFHQENAGKDEVHARHILVSTEAEAKKVVADLDGGQSFEELAKQRSSGPSAQTGGDLGFFAKEDMVAEFSDAAFALKPGAYTKEPVKTQFGWHVIKNEASRKRPVPPFEEVAGAIRNQLGQKAVAELVTELRAKAEIQKFDINGDPVAEETQAN